MLEAYVDAPRRDESKSDAPQGQLATAHLPVCWPTTLWAALVGAQRCLFAASQELERIRKEQRSGRHVRARRVEEAEDDEINAEQEVSLLQQQLGLKMKYSDPAAALAALETVTAFFAEWLLMLGCRLGQPAETWKHVMLYVLPVTSFGYGAAVSQSGDRVFGLRVSVPMPQAFSCDMSAA
eukprot:TRINITY_DN7381_c0_g1_i1.p1 TRINITY_DN7381_c0_g1~~TRINITY_DN7381_c0_g1_i1.p1  ORF type:complete len:181 (-),score=37.54 TRINITY_DN7381_c0_g1_i1:363-905(-)